MAVAITERAIGAIHATKGRTLVTVTGSEAEVAVVLAVGTGLTDPLHKWSGSDDDIVWNTGVVGAMSVAYIAHYPTTA
jgi:hypothetical protein